MCSFLGARCFCGWNGVSISIWTSHALINFHDLHLNSCFYFEALANGLRLSSHSRIFLISHQNAWHTFLVECRGCGREELHRIKGDQVLDIRIIYSIQSVTFTSFAKMCHFDCFIFLPILSGIFNPECSSVEDFWQGSNLTDGILISTASMKPNVFVERSVTEENHSSGRLEQKESNFIHTPCLSHPLIYGAKWKYPPVQVTEMQNQKLVVTQKSAFSFRFVQIIRIFLSQQK